MASTSVTGTGPGSAEGSNKGSARDTLGVSHLIGPHVVASGFGNNGIAATTFVVEMYDLPGVATDYICLVTQKTGTPIVFVAALADVAGPPAYMTLTVTAASNTNVWQWAVVKTGTS